MRMSLGEARTATADAFAYDGASRSARPEPYDRKWQPLLIEQAAAGGQRAAIRWSSEYRLLLAVLQDAVACWFRYYRPRNTREQRLFQEIHSWFLEKDQNWLFAFESICEYLDLDPDAIRRGLLRWQAASQPRLASAFQMRRVRRHRKIRPSYYDETEDGEF